MKFAFLCREPVYSVRKRVAVVGAGPAGLTATGYLVCRGYEVDVYDKLPYPGGMMVFAISRHRIPIEEVIEGSRDLEENFNVKFYLRTKVAIGDGRDEGDDFAERKADLLSLAKGYDAVIAATGTWRSRALGIEGENSKNVTTALTFLYKRRLRELKLANTETFGGIGKAIIIGAGLSAVDAAEECLSMGVKEVYLVYRRTIREAPAGMYKIKELVGRGVNWIELAQPKKIIVENGVAKGVEFTRVQLGPPDESGRPRPVPVVGTEFTLEADLVILAVGERPTPPIYSGELVKYVDASGRLIVGGDYRLPGTNIFAIGDVVTGPSKIGIAIDHTLKAIKTIDRLVSGEKIGIEDLLKKLKRVEKQSIKLVKWRDSLAKEICEFLNKHAEIPSDGCLSLAPFTRLFDYRSCIGCETCSSVCSFIHEGKSYIKIKKIDEGSVFPTSCLHCTYAKCQSVCKRNAITRGELGEVLIDYRKCNNCMDCIYACPLKAMRISKGAIANCDLCLILRSGGLEPACFSMCPSRAIKLIAK